MPEYDVIIIGSGTAGQTAAYQLRGAGFKIGLVEHSAKPGGTCALWGCQAKKYFYEGAETVARSRHMENMGIKTPAQGDWGQLLDAKNRFTQKVPENTVTGLERKGIDFIRGHARFTGEKSLSVAGTNYTMTNAIVATGAAPASLPIPGMELALDNQGFLELEKLPAEFFLWEVVLFRLNLLILQPGLAHHQAAAASYWKQGPGPLAHLMKRWSPC